MHEAVEDLLPPPPPWLFHTYLANWILYDITGHETSLFYFP